MNETRPFIKISHGFPEHHKTVELSDRAFRLLVEAWCMCARAENDGYLTDAQVSKLFPKKYRDELVRVGYLDQRAAGWKMHDYLDHQTSAAHIADLRQKRAEAGRRGGKAKATRVASAKQDAKQTASKNVPEVEVEEEEELKATTELPSSTTPMARAKYPAGFESFWQAYPRKVGKDSAFKAWVQASKRSSHAEIQAGAELMRSDPNLPEEQFIPHPTTWLRRGGWSDDPFPQRSQQQAARKESTTNARVNDATDAGRRLMVSLGQLPSNQIPMEITA